MKAESNNLEIRPKQIANQKYLKADTVEPMYPPDFSRATDFVSKTCLTGAV